MHTHSCILWFLLPVFIFALGCSNEKTVKKGDRFEVLVDLREAAEIQGDLAYSDGFTCEIPTGAIVEAMYSSTSAGFFECRVVTLDGKSDEAYILSKLVPEPVSRRPGFENFSVTFSMEYLDLKLKKISNP